MMLSVAKLRVGQEAYQLSGVAESLDDYYTGSGEAHGVWVGGSAARLGLDGQVRPDDLRAVLAGLRPGAGGLTPNGDRHTPHPRRVPGFDLTFKVPKSASVLYAVSDDPRVQGAVIEAGEVAMRSAIGWLEREAIRVRRGSHNQAWLAKHGHEPGAGPRQLPSSGVVAASFRHRTSRAGDPLLHWHVLVANLVEGNDGKWSAFLHSDLYRNVRAASGVFQAVFRSELSHSLGIEWRPGRHVAEIAGIPQSLLDEFSKRSRDVDDWLAATGTPNTPEGRQLAVLATRRHKPEVETGSARFDADWKREAETFGWGPQHAEWLLASDREPDPVEGYEGVWRLETLAFEEDGRLDSYERIVDPEEWIETVLRQDLTADRSSFTWSDLVAAIAARQGAGATDSTIDRVAHRFVASPHVIRVEADDDIDRWTSRELLDVEARFVAAVATTDTIAALPAAAVERAISDRPTLGPDQEAAVRTITSSMSPVTTLVGPAGSGKTYTVDAIRAAHQAAGHHVAGAAPSARAALELASGANLDAATLHSLLDGWQRGHDTPVRNSLLVIDEAAMADIRTLQAVVDRQLDAGGRVLLVGDHHQLPEIGAGGGFEHAAHHGHCVAELTVNRRQHQPWEQAALDQLRRGCVGDAVQAYLDHDRVIVANDAADMIHAAVELWLGAHDQGLRPILLAGTNDLVDHLNAAVIDRLVARGEISDTTTTYGGTSYRVGQRVVVRRNSPTEHTVHGDEVTVANGQSGTITSARDHHLTIRLDHGHEIVLDDRYLRRGGHLTHAYALTTHRAQGGTWGQAIAVGADGLYLEGAYVELSRGEHENWIVLTDPDAAEFHRQATTELDRHDTGLVPPEDQPGEVADELTARISRSRAKHLAHTTDTDVAAVERLARACTHHHLADHYQRAITAEHHAALRLGASRAELTTRRDRIDQVARHLTIGATVSPHDRNNIGTILRLDDRNGLADVHFSSRAGQEADRTFRWEQLRIVDTHQPERALEPDATATLRDLLSPIDQQIAEWDSILRAHRVEPGDADRYRRAIDQQITQATAHLVADQPDWLLRLLGPRPADPAGSHTWHDATRAVATWCTRHWPDDHTSGIGPRPDDASHAESWERLSTQLSRTRLWLATTHRTAADRPIIPSHDELRGRLDRLDQVLDQAPADCRHFIAELRSGQLSFTDTAELLQAALDQQGARRAWIIEHWPHVVEHQEVIAALEHGAWGPDPTLLHDLADTTPISDQLADAIERDEPWLRAVLTATASRTDTQLAPDVVELFEDIAAYRREHDIDTTSPLGPASYVHDDEFAERLRRALDAAAAQLNPNRSAVDLDGW